MTYEEMIEISEEFYNTIDFTKFIHINFGKIDIRDLMNCLEEYYDMSHPNLLPPEFEGFFFNFMDENDFAEYISKRYGYKIITEVIEKHWLQINS